MSMKKLNIAVEKMETYLMFVVVLLILPQTKLFNSDMKVRKYKYLIQLTDAPAFYSL